MPALSSSSAMIAYGICSEFYGNKQHTQTTTDMHTCTMERCWNMTTLCHMVSKYAISHPYITEHVNTCNNKKDLFRLNMTDSTHLNSICSVTMTQCHFPLCCLFCLCICAWVCVCGSGRVCSASTVTPPWPVLHCFS